MLTRATNRAAHVIYLIKDLHELKIQVTVATGRIRLEDNEIIGA